MNKRPAKKKLKSNDDADYLYGIHAIMAMLERYPERIITIFVVSNLAGTERTQNRRIQHLQTSAKHHGISCQQLTPAKAKEKVGAVNHQGVIAEYRPSPVFDHHQLIQDVVACDEIKLLVLDGVTDPHNLGACIRSAEALGVRGVVVAKHHSAPFNATVRKVASGAAEFVSLYQVTNLARTLVTLKDHFVQVVGASCNSDATPLSQVEFEPKCAIIMGSEGEGLRALTEKHCDRLAYIQMKGSVKSLNVSVAAGIFLYESLK